MLFNFQLRPLADVAPWGSPGDRSLHWFGLTDGWYWLQMNERDEVLRYTPKLLEHWHRKYPEQSLPMPYVDYYVVRLWEDLQDILADILEPLPPALVHMLETEEQVHRWLERVRRWQEEIELDNEAWDTLTQAIAWWEHRKLDTGYLTASPRLWFWNNGSTIHVYWDNRQLSIDDIPAWTAQQGMIQFTPAQFLDEVHSFHNRLMAAMAERTQEAKNFRFRPGIRLDLVALEKEQQDRTQWLARCLKRASSRPATSWDTAIEAITTLS